MGLITCQDSPVFLMRVGCVFVADNHFLVQES